MVATRTKQNGLRVGDKVRFQFGSEVAKGTIIEERGPLAPGRRDVYRIQFRFSEGDDMFVELADHQFERTDEKD